MTMVQSEPSHQEVKDMLGAFALDATEPAETAAVRAHLAGCPRCRAEVADLRSAAAALAYSGADAPEGVWDKIAASLDEAPPPLRLVAADQRDRTSRMLRVASIAASIMVVAALAITTLARAGGRDHAGAATLDGAVIAALTNPKATQVHLTSSSTAPYGAVVVLLPDGVAYLVPNDLPALPSDRTYQLWGQVGDIKVSLGVLGSHPDKAAFIAKANLIAIAITNEVAGGAVQPTNPPVVAGLVTVHST